MDYIYQLSCLPRPGGGAHILAMRQAAGGVEANVAAALARLGLRVGLISRLGDDDNGRWLLQDLRAWGVDDARVQTLPAQSSDFCQVWVGPDGERMLACYNPALRALQLQEADRRYLAQARVLFLSAFAPLTLLQSALDLARQAGLATALDLPDSFDDLAGRGLSRADFWRLLPQIDLLLTNHVGLSSLLHLAEVEAALAAFGQRAPAVRLALTLGADGAWLGQGERWEYTPAFAVEVVDTTGAGDAFHAALIYAWLLAGWPAGRAGRFASALAALNCAAWGARGGLVDAPTVERFLAAHADKSQQFR